MTADVMRKPCKTPREAMSWVAHIIGGIIGDDLGDKRLPRCDLTLRSSVDGGRVFEASVHCWVGLDGDELRIRIDVGWPSSRFTPAEAAVAASLCKLAAERAQLAESFAHGRVWNAREILDEKGLDE